MRGRGALAAAIGALLLIPATATAADPPPGAAISANLEYVKRVPGAAGSSRASSTRCAARTSSSSPAASASRRTTSAIRRTRSRSTSSCPPGSPADADSPRRLLAERGHGARHEAQADHRRARSSAQRRDPPTARARTPTANAVRDPDCKSGFYVISYADPKNMRQIGDFVTCRPATRRAASRTASTSGPAAPPGAATRTGSARSSARAAAAHADNRRDRRRPADLGHRPARPARPEVSDQPIDLWRNDRYTDYSHDVDEDENGIAWVSGRGGIRGYATSGWHRDPYQNRLRRATPFDPILVAGGGLAWDEPPVAQRQAAWRRPRCSCTTPAARPTAPSAPRA